MFEEIRKYVIEDNEYNVRIIRKRVRNSYLRYKKDQNLFVLTTSRLVPISSLENFILKSIPKLIKKSDKNFVQPITNEYYFEFGEKKNNNFENSGDLLEILRSDLFEYLNKRVPYFGSQMGITNSYSIKVRNAKTRFGSNSRKTNTLSFCFDLVHFDYEVIDSVIIHELAHYFVYNHSAKFYHVVYQYCPNYKELRKRLLKKKYGKDS